MSHVARLRLGGGSWVCGSWVYASWVVWVERQSHSFLKNPFQIYYLCSFSESNYILSSLYGWYLLFCVTAYVLPVIFFRPYLPFFRFSRSTPKNYVPDGLHITLYMHVRMPYLPAARTCPSLCSKIEMRLAMRTFGPLSLPPETVYRPMPDAIRLPLTSSANPGRLP